MAEALPNVRAQVLSLKVADLQAACGRLGLTRSGRKTDLQARLLGYLGESCLGSSPTVIPLGKVEQAMRVVRDAYCASKNINQKTGTPPLHSASLPPTATTFTAAAAASAGVSPTRAPAKTVRCLCKGLAVRTKMLQCKNPRCGVWQHAECVGANQSAKDFHCEQCRAGLADPFWERLEELLPPARLRPVVGQPLVRDNYTGDMHPVVSMDQALFLGDQQLLEAQARPEALQIQITCLLLEDTVPFRFHWPRGVTLKVNNLTYRPYSRNVNMKMGVNQRDAPANVTTMCFRGRNVMEVVATECGSWVVIVQRARRRTDAEVKALMAAEEGVAEAVVRVKKLLGGGGGGGEDEDDDGIAVASQMVSLKDPMSGQRMAVPVRFSDASGLQPFDLDSFLSLAGRNRKWQDPTTLKNSTVAKLQVDVYMQQVLRCMEQHPSVTDIEINDEAQWRPDKGGAGRWFSIESSPEEVRAGLAADESSGNGSDAKANGGMTPKVEGVALLDSDNESDEEEELRQAAAAVRPAAAAAAAKAGEKRKAIEEPEVIDLVSSSDEEGPVTASPAGGQAAATAAATAFGAAAAALAANIAAGRSQPAAAAGAGLSSAAASRPQTALPTPSEQANFRAQIDELSAVVTAPSISQPSPRFNAGFVNSNGGSSSGARRGPPISVLRQARLHHPPPPRPMVHANARYAELPANFMPYGVPHAHPPPPPQHQFFQQQQQFGAPRPQQYVFHDYRMGGYPAGEQQTVPMMPQQQRVFSHSIYPGLPMQIPPPPPPPRAPHPASRVRSPGGVAGPTWSTVGQTTSNNSSQEQRLSQEGREAAEQERAFFAANPQLLDDDDVDEW